MVTSHIAITECIAQSCISWIITTFPERTLNDDWNDERGVLLSEEPRIGLEQLGSKSGGLSCLNKWVNGRPTKVPKYDTTRYDLAHCMAPSIKETKSRGDSSPGRRRDPIPRSSPNNVDLRRFARRFRIPQGDLRGSSKTCKVRGSFNAVRSQTRRLWETRSYAGFLLLSETKSSANATAVE